MQAVVLAIGDELVLGQTVDTNSPYLSAQLARRGIGTLYHQVVADDQSAIARAIAQAAQSAELVLISGGLGPTEDDLTRQALTQALGTPLLPHPECLAELTAYFASRGRDMPERNKVQALCPGGARPIPNSCGTAPGLRAALGRATIYITPGVPNEMAAMFTRSIAPELDHLGPSRGIILTLKLNTFGLGESALAELLGPLMDRQRNPKVGTTVAGGVVAVRLRSEFPTLAQAQRELDQTAQEVEQRLTPYLYGREEETLQQALVAELKKSGQTLATAESCTGGLVGKFITDVPGSSTVYRGGWVVYSNQMKSEQLGVPAALLDQHGAVSRPVAMALAEGASRISGADIGVGVTGVAGPDGGTPEKPIGMVWVALALRTPAPVAPPFGAVMDKTPGRSPVPQVPAPAPVAPPFGAVMDKTPGRSPVPRVPAPAPVAPPFGAVMDKTPGRSPVPRVPAPGSSAGFASDALCLNLFGDRAAIRDRAAKCTLQMLRFTLLGVPLETLTWGKR